MKNMAYRNAFLEPYMTRSESPVPIAMYNELVKMLIQAWTELDELQDRHTALIKQVREPTRASDIYKREDSS